MTRVAALLKSGCIVAELKAFSDLSETFCGRMQVTKIGLDLRSGVAQLTMRAVRRTRLPDPSGLVGSGD
jgi:hypothetical protein